MIPRLACTIMLLVVSTVFAAAHEYEAGTIKVQHPWARATPAGAKVGAAYLKMEATRLGGDRLIGARSDVAGRVELHKHIHANGVMKMRKVDAIAVSAGRSVTLEPSGLHLMLMELKEPLKEGDILPITLVFEKAGEMKVEASVEPIGATGPHGFEGQPGATPAKGTKGHHAH